MPCNSNHLEAKDLEVEISKVCCLLDELEGRPIQPHWWNGYHPAVYNKVTRKMADVATERLCTVLRRHDDEEIKDMSPEMQIWWREHKKVDDAREEAERVEAIKQQAREEMNQKLEAEAKQNEGLADHQLPSDVEELRSMVRFYIRRLEAGTQEMERKRQVIADRNAQIARLEEELDNLRNYFVEEDDCD